MGAPAAWRLRSHGAFGRSGQGRGASGQYIKQGMKGLFYPRTPSGQASIVPPVGPSLDTRSSGVGLVFSVPLFSGGGTQSRVRQALANRERAAQDLENSLRSVAQTVRQNYLGVTNGVLQVKALEAALVSNKSSLDATVLGKDVGVRTNVDVLNAQQQLFQAQRDLQQARYNTILAQLRLKAASGRLKEEDLAEVNRLLAK